MLIAQSLMFLLVYSFKVVYGDEDTESTTVLNSSQGNNDLKTSIVSEGGREIKSELSGCSLRISISGLKGCSAETKDSKELKEVSRKEEEGFLEGQKELKGEPEKTGERVIDGLNGAPGNRLFKGEPGLSGPGGPKGDTGSKGEPGLKGAEGLIGLPGLVGLKGDPGPKGEKGLDGIKGTSGDKGSKGDQGQKGDKGLDGEQGLKGDNGNMGIQGPPGLVGEKGDRGKNGIGIQGEKGEKGESGAPGRNCEKDLTPGETRPSDVGTLSNPATSCLHIDSRDDGDYFLNPSDKFSAKCDFTNNRVCYLKPSTTDNTKYNFLRQPFWLSKTGFKIENLYGNIFPRIEYLRKITSYATQRIRINCKNTFVIPTSESDKEKFLQILLWNDVLIGPEATDRSPVSYTVIEDHCNLPEGGYADIEISTYATRLPIVDLYIRDIRKLDQAISIEFLELCFTFNAIDDD